MLLLTGLPGCAEDQAPSEADDDFADFDLRVSETEGVVRGVVVDESIVPVPDIEVILLVPGDERRTVTDADGRFAFGGVPAGTYRLNVTSLRHHPVQSTATVEAGDAEPELVKVQLERRFSQDPYSEQHQLAGRINCGYSLLLSSPCVIDYTMIVVPGGAAPQLNGITGDVRRFVLPVRDGWQSMVMEMVWDSSLSATSESLSLTTSFFERTSSHSYTGTAGPSPLWLKMDLDPERTHPDWVPPEGKEDFLMFVNPSTAGSGLPMALNVEQSFELFRTDFYFAVPPESWSLVAGDAPPF